MRVTCVGAVLIALFFSTPALRGTQEPAGATVTGRVVNADNGAPIDHARVMLIPTRRPGGTVPMGMPPQTLTGDDGAYVFTAVAAGEYRVQADKPGFVVNPSDMQTFVVADGQTGAVADFRLRRGGAITGRVLDAHGEGLASVSVRAVPPPAERGRGQSRPIVMAAMAQAVETNDIGEFRIPGLASGDYYVAAAPRQFSPFQQASGTGGATSITTFYPGLAEMAGARAVTVAAGQTASGVEFVMLSAPGFAVSGVVVDEAGRPVGNGIVSVSSAPTSMVPSAAMLGYHALSHTRPDGSFTLGGLPPGTYRLTASVLITVSTGGGGFSSSSTSAQSPSTPLSVTLKDSDVTGVRLVALQRR